ncbi:hypothetical protein L6R52_01990 [Myxococcota bacterium]|nr:hypothetical protein [Myxococcota bacterium]
MSAPVSVVSVLATPRRGLAPSLVLIAALLGACGGADDPSTDRAADGITHRDEITPVTDASKALPGVLVPPFVDCRDPLPGDSTTNPSGQVCTNVSVAGATEPGKSFAAYASCDVVRTQRPVWPAPPASVPAEDDPRLDDAALVAELAWAKEQVAATGCQCCHDSGIGKGPASQWDLSAGPLWLDSLSDTGLALFTGLADSSVLGAYPADQNHGFDRAATGIPTTDTARMKALLLAELTRRGLTEDDARAVPPFGGPIYQNAIREPEACGPGQGVTTDGRVLFSFGQARYVYVLEAGSANPGVPPNRDRPAGLVWRLDVLPSAEPLESGLLYGKTPPGSYQDTPALGAAPPLVEGRTYHLSVLLDVGFPVTNCLFVYGQPISS